MRFFKTLLKLDLFDFFILTSAIIDKISSILKLRWNTLKRRQGKAMRKLKLNLERQSPIVESLPSGLFPRNRGKEKDTQKIKKSTRKPIKKALKKFDDATDYFFISLVITNFLTRKLFPTLVENKKTKINVSFAV